MNAAQDEGTFEDSLVVFPGGAVRDRGAPCVGAKRVAADAEVRSPVPVDGRAAEDAVSHQPIAVRQVVVPGRTDRLYDPRS